MTLPEQRPGRYHIIISAAVTQNTEPLQAAEHQLELASSTPGETLKKEHQDWWQQYWAKSFLCLESLDQQADWLTAAYHVHLYTLACLNRGQVPHNYDGGGPVLDWVQEVRFIFNPLRAANRMEMAQWLPPPCRNPQLTGTTVSHGKSLV